MEEHNSQSQLSHHWDLNAVSLSPHNLSSVSKYHCYSKHTHHRTLSHLFKQFLNGNNKNDQKLVSFALQLLLKSIYSSRNC